MGLYGGYGARTGHADTCRGSGGVPLAQHAMNMGTGWGTSSCTCIWLALWPTATAEAILVTSVSPMSPCPRTKCFLSYCTFGSI